MWKRIIENGWSSWNDTGSVRERKKRKKIFHLNIFFLLLYRMDSLLIKEPDKMKTLKSSASALRTILHSWIGKDWLFVIYIFFLMYEIKFKVLRHFVKQEIHLYVYLLIVYLSNPIRWRYIKTTAFFLINNNI